MAERLHYTTEPTPSPNHREELEALIEVLSASGTLRALQGLVGRFPAIIEAMLDQANTSAGRSAIGSLLLVGELLSKLPTEALIDASQGLEKGLGKASLAFSKAPPSTLALLREANDPDTRRAIAAGLALLKELGASMREADPAGTLPDMQDQV